MPDKNWMKRSMELDVPGWQGREGWTKQRNKGTWDKPVRGEHRARGSYIVSPGCSRVMLSGDPV